MIDLVLPVLGPEDAGKQVGGGNGIGQGPVPLIDMNAEVADQIAEAVGGQAGKTFSRQLHGAQGFPGVSISQPAKLLPDKTVIEAGVVGHKDSILGHLDNGPRHLPKPGRAGHHVVGNAGEL